MRRSRRQRAAARSSGSHRRRCQPLQRTSCLPAGRCADGRSSSRPGANRRRAPCRRGGGQTACDAVLWSPVICRRVWHPGWSVAASAGTETDIAALVVRAEGGVQVRVDSQQANGQDADGATHGLAHVGVEAEQVAEINVSGVGEAPKRLRLGRQMDTRLEVGAEVVSRADARMVPSMRVSGASSGADRSGLTAARETLVFEHLFKPNVQGAAWLQPRRSGKRNRT